MASAGVVRRWSPVVGDGGTVLRGQAEVVDATVRAWGGLPQVGRIIPVWDGLWYGRQGRVGVRVTEF